VAAVEAEYGRASKAAVFSEPRLTRPRIDRPATKSKSPTAPKTANRRSHATALDPEGDGVVDAGTAATGCGVTFEAAGFRTIRCTTAFTCACGFGIGFAFTTALVGCFRTGGRVTTCLGVTEACAGATVVACGWTTLAGTCRWTVAGRCTAGAFAAGFVCGFGGVGFGDGAGAGSGAGPGDVVVALETVIGGGSSARACAAPSPPHASRAIASTGTRRPRRTTRARVWAPSRIRTP
jgi:hypothetical protein